MAPFPCVARAGREDFKGNSVLRQGQFKKTKAMTGDPSMILYMGVRTTQPIEAVYRVLSPDEDEAPAVSQLLPSLNIHGFYGSDAFDHSMVINYDSPETEGRRRELLIPVRKLTVNEETKIIPPMRVAFLVFKGTDKTIEEYYEYLKSYKESEGLLASSEIYSVEVMYVPESLDDQEYTMEIMIPLAD